MIKKIFMVTTLVILAASAFAQDDTTGDYNYGNYSYTQPRYRKRSDNIKHFFVGGNLIAGFYSGGGAFGINPGIGYSFNQYVDAGLMLNAVYSYQSYYDSKQHTWNLGAAPFVRVFPIPYIFLGASFEDNYVTTKYISGTTYNQSWNVPSLIGSIGYYTRVYGQSFFFFSIGMDFLTNVNSPYREPYYNSDGTVSSRALPIIRAGFGINLW
jgi:hypothetical protein